jgi:hypothetical protein
MISVARVNVTISATWQGWWMAATAASQSACLTLGVAARDGAAPAQTFAIAINQNPFYFHCFSPRSNEAPVLRTLRWLPLMKPEQAQQFGLSLLKIGPEP